MPTRGKAFPRKTGKPQTRMSGFQKANAAVRIQLPAKQLYATIRADSGGNTWGYMATLQQDIATKFISALEEGKEVDSDKIEEIRKLLSDDKKIKADDFVKIFSTPVGGDVK